MKNTNGMIRLIIQLALILVAAVAAWGAIRHQVVNTVDDVKYIKEVELPKIDKDKLDKAIFDMHAAEQVRSWEKLDKTMVRFEEKLDKALEK